jgi:hypothetical protein
MPPPPLKDNDWKDVIRPVADVLVLLIADKDLMLHMQTVS